MSTLQTEINETVGKELEEDESGSDRNDKGFGSVVQLVFVRYEA